MATKRAGDGTAIEWTHQPGYKGISWNPTVGCTRVSAGCDHCYAFALHDKNYAVNLRYARQLGYRTTEESRADPLSHPPFPRQYDVPFSQVQIMDERIEQPLHWKSPRAVFVDSMADLFHVSVPDDVLDHIFAAMALAPRHIFMILTKRPERMRRYIQSRGPGGSAHSLGYWMGQMDATLRDSFEITWPLPNVWLGTSVEDQTAANTRIPFLIDTPAAVRFLSCEPLLGPLNLRNIDAERLSRAYDMRTLDGSMHMYFVDPLTGHHDDMGRPCPDVGSIDWVIVGGESGAHRRPMDEEWARQVREQCDATGTAFFYKQTSAARPGQPGPADLNARKAFPTRAM